MFGFFVDLLVVSFVLAYNIQAQNTVPSTPAGNSRNGQSCVFVKTELTGKISSPSYPNKYPPNMDCTWTIKAPSGNVIELFFQDFMIEGTQGCQNDYMLLFDGPNSSSPEVGRYCNIAPPSFTSSGNYVHVEFRSDGSLGYRGFYAKYNITSVPTRKPTLAGRPPKFVQTLLNKTVTEDNTVMLVCEVTGIPEPVITWKKDSHNLTENERIVVEDRPFKSVLTITKATMSDQGKYSCVADNGIGLPVHSKSLVEVKHTVSPLIKKITEDKTVNVGNKVILKCKAVGQPPMTIRWTEKHKTLEERVCETHRVCRMEMIRRIVVNTVITCEAFNKAGNIARKVVVKVKGPPLITYPPQNRKVHVGDLVNFSCEAVGNPPVKISWKKGNQTVSDGVTTERGRSVFRFFVREDMTVTCNAEDQDGITSSHAQVTVTELRRIPLTVTITPGHLNVKQKTTVTLKCQAKGYPEPKLSWVQDGINIIKNIKFSKGVSTLTLESVEKSVSIACIARNDYEKILSNATVEVDQESSVDTRPLGSTPGTFSNDMKLILGAVGGLVLTIVIVIVLVIRRRKNKKNQAKDAEKTEAPKENENLISNPLFTKEVEESCAKEGIEALYYPRGDITHCEDMENDANVQVFLGRATDLPFHSGEYKVLVKVLKDSDPSEEIKNQFAMEASLLASFDHDSVVRLMAVCVGASPLCLVFEYSEYGYLDEYLQDCDPSDYLRKGKRKTALVRDSYMEIATVDRLSMAKQVADGMQYLTEKGYTHQELRAHNCMVFNNVQVKVANLGMRWAKPEQNFFAMSPEEKQKFPVRWLAPEVILYGEQEHSESADVWSYGVVVWEIFSDGLLPYTAINDNDVVSYVRSCNILPRPKVCPQEVYEILKTCWEITPVDRPKFSSLYKTMSSLHAGIRV